MRVWRARLSEAFRARNRGSENGGGGAFCLYSWLHKQHACAHTACKPLLALMCVPCSCSFSPLRGQVFPPSNAALVRSTAAANNMEPSDNLELDFVFGYKYGCDASSRTPPPPPTHTHPPPTHTPHTHHPHTPPTHPPPTTHTHTHKAGSTPITHVDGPHMCCSFGALWTCADAWVVAVCVGPGRGKDDRPNLFHASRRGATEVVYFVGRVGAWCGGIGLRFPWCCWLHGLPCFAARAGRVGRGAGQSLPFVECVKDACAGSVH